MTMMIKICGITNLEDATRAVELGADTLGFNFYPRSPRFISPAQADRIIEYIPREVLTVGIVVGRRRTEVGSVAAVQLHGLESEADLEPWDRPVLVAVSPATLDAFPNFQVVIDSSWGTGKKEDWAALRKIDREYILSGGLTPENVASAIRMLRPRGVDVCSGVESAPGKKDPAKLKRFIRSALAAAGPGSPPRSQTSRTKKP